MTTKNNVIGINIWDDYFGDEDDITNDYDSSEIEEYNNTYAYVEYGENVKKSQYYNHYVII